MAAEDLNREVTTQGECTDCTERERSFDALARGLANGSISRRKALRMLGAALVGGAVASIPGMGWLAGDSGGAQAAPGGSTCSNEGQSCVAQKCCQGLVCIGQSGNKVCCPKSRACGSLCCATGQTCLANNVCGGCPPGEVLCATQANPTGECCPAPTGPDAPCRVAACGNGTCTTAPKSGSNGTPCNDNNPCTENDQCTNGVCAGTQITGCVQCQTVADCGSAVPVPNQCQQRACTGGVCTIVNKPNGTNCNDNHPCTENDMCTDGVCAGTPIANCLECSVDNECASVPVDQCHQAVCGPEGFCIVENKPNDTGCNADNNACTVNDTCQAGVCTPGQLRECPQPNDPCLVAVCNPATGNCEIENAPDDTPCEDGDLCTVGDTCQNGTCQAGDLTTCPDTGNQCTVSVCNPGTGVCEVQNRPNGTSCDDNNSCTENDMCTGGICAGTRITGCVNCTNDQDCSTVAVTDCQEAFCQANNTCGVRNKADGTACEDGNPCTVGDTCQAGVCVTGSPKNCDDGNICTVDTCNQMTGQCEHQTIPGCCNTATDCPTPTDRCQQATCVNNACGTTPVTCPGSQVCVNGTCVCPSGTTACGSSSCCTSAQCCQSGTCQAGNTNTACGTGGGTCTACAGQTSFCCGAGTGRPFQCRRPTGATCSNNNQCCNSCSGGVCT